MTEIDWIYRLTERITGPLAGVERALGITDNAALQLEKDISKIGSQTSFTGNILKSFGTIAATAFAGFSIGMVGKQIFDLGTAMEETQMNYKTLLKGDTAGASKLMEDRKSTRLNSSH